MGISASDCQKFFPTSDFLNPPKPPFYKGGLLKEFPLRTWGCNSWTPDYSGKNFWKGYKIIIPEVPRKVKEKCADFRVKG
jgi:hypothetical protein